MAMIRVQNSQRCRSYLKNKILVQFPVFAKRLRRDKRAGTAFLTAGILQHFEELRPPKSAGSDGPSRTAGKRGTHPAEKGGRPKDVFEIASKAAVYALLIMVLIPVLMSCSDSQEQNEATATTAVLPESFTFFDLGINSRLNKSVRRDLTNKLGRDAIEHRSILDLEINYNGFLKAYFPRLSALNQKLNFPPGERVEHNTIKLMYRYALKKDVPFDYVELVFSNYSQAPLAFRIYFRDDEAGIIDTLESKYGRPQVIQWQEESGKSMYWKKNDDVLIVSLVPDQFGNPAYQIAIYFVKNLEQLIAAEKKERQEKSLKRTESGKTAF